MPLKMSHNLTFKIFYTANVKIISENVRLVIANRVTYDYNDNMNFIKCNKN